MELASLTKSIKIVFKISFLFLKEFKNKSQNLYFAKNRENIGERKLVLYLRFKKSILLSSDFLNIHIIKYTQLYINIYIYIYIYLCVCSICFVNVIIRIIIYIYK